MEICLLDMSYDGNVISLEENDEFKGILDPKYSDVSDFEDDKMEQHHR